MSYTIDPEFADIVVWGNVIINSDKVWPAIKSMPNSSDSREK
jgi:hypothetical protein